MPAAQFTTLTIDRPAARVMATGTLDLDAGEDAMVICIRICQNGVTVAECGPDHPFEVTGGTWEMPAEFIGSVEPVAGPAIAAAVAITSGPTPCQMNSYQWTQPQMLA